MEDSSSFDDEPVKFTKFRIIKNLVLISITFFLAFTAFDSLSMLQSTMNKEGNVGIMSLAFLYLGFCVSALLFSKFGIKRLGCKLILNLSTVFCLPYIAANIYPHWSVMIPSAFVMGICASFVWSSQSTYFNQSAVLYCMIASKDKISKKKRNSAPTQENEEMPMKNSDDVDRDCPNSQVEPSLAFCKEPLSHEHSSQNDFSNNRHVISNINRSSGLNTKTECKDKSLIADDHQSPDKPNSYKVNQRFKVVRLMTHDHLNEHSRQVEKSLTPDSGETETISSAINKLSSQRSLSCARNSIYSQQSRNYCNKFVRRSTGYSDAIQRFSGLEAVTARFFGFHGFAYHFSQVMGSLMSYSILRNESVNNTAYFNGSSCLCGAAYCSSSEVICFEQSDNEVSSDQRYLLTGVSFVLVIAGFLLLFFFLDDLQTDKEPVSFNIQVLMSTLSHCKRKDQLLLIPISFYAGMVQAFYMADFTKSYIGCAWGTSQVGLVTISFGAACAIAAPLSGLMVKYVGRISIMTLCQAVNVAAAVLLLVWTPESQQKIMFHFVAGILGVVSGILRIQIPAFYGILFTSNEEAAYGAFYLFCSLGWFFQFTISDFICTSIKIYLLITVSSVGLVGYLFTEKLYSSAKKQISRAISSEEEQPD